MYEAACDCCATQQLYSHACIYLKSNVLFTSDDTFILATDTLRNPMLVTSISLADNLTFDPKDSKDGHTSHQICVLSVKQCCGYCSWINDTNDLTVARA